MENPDWASIASKVIGAGAPVLGGILGGPAGAAAGNIVGSILGAALGVPATPADVGDALNDPAAAAKVAAAEAIHAPGMSLLEAQVEEMQSARAQTVDLAKQGSTIAWGAPVISFVVTLGFTFVCAVAMLRVIPDNQIAATLVGMLAMKFGTTVDYWLGSSFDSSNKSSTIGAAFQALIKVGRK